MTWVNINRFSGNGSVGAAPPGSNNVGSSYRNDVFFTPPAGRIDLLNALVSCWGAGHITNILRIWHNGKPDSAHFNYSTDQLVWQVGPDDVYAIPKEWGVLPANCSPTSLVGASGAPIIIDPAAVYKKTPTTPIVSGQYAPKQTQTSANANYTPISAAQAPAVNAAATNTQIVAAPSTAPSTGMWIWVLGGLAALGGVAAYLHYQHGGARSNPWAPKDYIEVERLHISRDGYARGGRYFGVGAPVYRWDYNGETGFVRAANAKEARKKARRREGRSW